MNDRVLPQSEGSGDRPFQIVIWLISLSLIGLGAAVILGWVLDIERLKGLSSDLPTIKVNTAMCLILGGISLGCAHLTALPQFERWRQGWGIASQIAAGLMMWLGGGTMLEYGWGVDLGLDQWLVPQPDPFGSLAAPGRMSPNTAIAFFFIGNALVFTHYSVTWWVPQISALLAGFVGFIALLGYLYGVTAFYGVGSTTGMAIHTALGCLALSLGILSLYPRRGWLAILLGPYSGSRLLRRVLPLIVLVQPIIWGVVGNRQLQHYYTSSDKGAIASTVSIVFLSAVVTWNAYQLNRLNQHEASARDELQISQARLKGILDYANDAIITIDDNHCITLFNPGAEKIFGYQASAVLGQPLSVLLPHRFHQVHQRHVTDFRHSAESAKVMGKRQEIFGQRRDGSEFPAEASISQQSFHGKKLLTVFLRDISDRKRGEDEQAKTLQALQTSEERANALLEHLPIGIFQTTTTGQCEYVNQRWSAMTGLSLDQALGEGWITALHPADRNSVFAAWEQFVQGNCPFALEYRFLKPDGQEVWVQGNAIALQNETEQVVGYLGSTLDISERKQAETTTQALIQAIPDYLVRMRRDGLQQEVFNSDAIHVINPRKPQLGSNISDLMPADIAQERIRLAAAAIATGQVQTQIYSFDLHGETRHEEARVTLLSHQDVLVMVRDITEQVQTEHVLRESEATKRALINAIPDLMMRIRQDGTYVDVLNKDSTTVNILRPNANVSGSHIMDALPTDLANERMAYVHRALATGQIQKYEYQIEVEGNLYDEEARLIPLDGTSVLAVVRDITEQKKKEKLLEQAKQDAETASRTKSEFLANMSHEIRTPMNAVLGFTELLESMVTEAIARDYLQAIASSGRTLLALINDILDLSKIEAGRLELYPESVNIRALVQDICTIFNPKALGKGITLTGAIAESVPTELLIDEVRIRQILFNIVDNALKFTETGQISIRVDLCSQEAEVSTCLQIVVQDTGIGIAPSQQSQIFETFTQSEGQSNRKFGGTGLGLAITRRLVTLMGGHISLDSQLGQGSTFTFQFPNVKISTPETATLISDATDADLNQFAPARVLVVDDIPSNRSLLAGYFRETIHTLAFAKNGEVAVRIALDWQPDIILMDLRMPVMDGLETSRRLKEFPLTHHIPIVVVTASSQAKDENVLRDLCEGFIRKPVSPSSLVAALKPVLPSVESGHPGISLSEAAASIEAEKILSPAQHEALTEQLQSLATTLWEPLQKKLLLEQFELFVESLNQLAIEFPYPPLVQYAQILSQQLEDFDWAVIPQTVERFSVLLNTLANEGSSNTLDEP